MTTLAWFIGMDAAWLTQPAIRWPLTIIYLLLLALVGIYGLHRYWLVYLYLRHRNEQFQPKARFDELPGVTVQLPMFNEAQVAQRIIDAACALDYPADRLQIQVLDDSTQRADADIARQRVEFWAKRGVNIEYIHRTDRRGYKAGALDDAMPRATGQFIAIFDADFVPGPDFLRRVIDPFTDPAVGMVQCRWDHLNRDDSLLTRAQAIYLDGHFLIEHTARNRAGRWINFNGTAGVWRRDAIADAGGWHHDTLTEDVDLSYRAQLKGWQFVYLPGVGCPAELPPEMNAFKSQQHRWTKGSIQVARKLLPTILRSDASAGRKIEAVFHLTAPMVYLYVTAMALLFFPAFFVNLQPFEDGSVAALLLGVTLFVVGTLSGTTYYVVSQMVRGQSVWVTLLHTPLLMALGIGIAVNNARGCVEALLGHESPFVRTPKYNTGRPSPASQPASEHAPATRRGVFPAQSLRLGVCAVELALGLYTLNCAILAWSAPRDVITVSLPFLLLFAAGYFYVGIASLWHLTAPARQTAIPVPQPNPN